MTVGSLSSRQLSRASERKVLGRGGRGQGRRRRRGVSGRTRSLSRSATLTWTIFTGRVQVQTPQEADAPVQTRRAWRRRGYGSGSNGGRRRRRRSEHHCLAGARAEVDEGLGQQRAVEWSGARMRECFVVVGRAVQSRPFTVRFDGELRDLGQQTPRVWAQSGEPARRVMHSQGSREEALLQLALDFGGRWRPPARARAVAVAGAVAFGVTADIAEDWEKSTYISRLIKKYVSLRTCQCQCQRQCQCRCRHSTVLCRQCARPSGHGMHLRGAPVSSFKTVADACPRQTTREQQRPCQGLGVAL